MTLPMPALESIKNFVMLKGLVKFLNCCIGIYIINKPRISDRGGRVLEEEDCLQMPPIVKMIPGYGSISISMN
jgi:hypothetical protein